MMMGAREIRLHALKMAVQMNRRVTKEDPVPSPEQLVDYAKKLAGYIKEEPKG